MMLRNTRKKSTTGRSACMLVFIGLVLSIVVAGCSSGDRDAEEPPACTWTVAGCQAAGPEAVVIVDVSGSVQGTDLLDAAHNHAVDLINTMPIGATIYVRSFHADITMMCRELAVTRVEQPNDALDEEQRQATVAGFSIAFDRFLKCAQETNPGGTRVFDGLAEAITLHPQALTYAAFTDYCDTAFGTCRPRNLRDRKYPGKLIQRLPVALTPPLSPGTVVRFYGIGRNTGLDATDVNTLRGIAQAWTQATGATAEIRDI